MKLAVNIGGRTRAIEIGAHGRRVHGELDGRPFDADATEVAPGIYSILLGGQSFEARVEPHGPALRIFVAGREFSAEIIDTRRWRRRRGTALETEGRQQVIAPMPGKVIRVLVKTGDAVEAGQGLLVVEAMKMQNEIRAPKSGTVERLFVAEGQAVNAGEVLAIVA
jgi:biotin carboxyl carrier protein